MRAIGLTSYGGPEVLQQVKLPDPHRASGIGPGAREGTCTWY
jgi:hypothetical protein